MSSVTPVGYEVNFSPLGPGANIYATKTQSVVIPISTEQGPAFGYQPTGPGQSVNQGPNLQSPTVSDNGFGLQPEGSFQANYTATTSKTTLVGRSPPAKVGLPTPALATRIHVTQSAYGSIGSAEISTTITEQPFGDFISACRKQMLEAEISVTADTSTLANPGSVKKVPLFDGFVDTPKYSLAADELVIPCRDRSSLLLENDVRARQYSNKVIFQIVKDLVTQAGYTTPLQQSLISTSGPAALTYGTFLRNSRSITQHKTTAWKLIQKMAEAIGYVAYATPDDRFYFGPRVRADLPKITLSWGGKNQQGDILGDPVIDHTPTRNGAFFVQVSSHDPETGSQIQHTITYANPEWAAAGASGGVTGAFVKGLTETQARNQYGQIQTYDFYAEGLTPEAAALKAMAHALDIQAHELIFKCRILGNADVQIGQSVCFSNTGFPAIDQTTFFFAGISHDLAIAQKGNRASGFVSDLIAWQTLGGT